MPPESNLQIFNPAATAGGEQSKFPLFRFFPVEIRRKIWEHSLQRHRYIHIRLQPRIDQPDFEERRLYYIVACGYQLLSKLFRVNRESRDSAVHFYRVHLPCEFSKTETLYETTKHGTLHLNPEYDILQVSPLWGVKNIVIDFLYHLKATHDPLHIGTRNLAMELNDLNGNDLHQIRASDIDPPVRSTLVELLTQLRDFYFVSKQTVGRQIFGFHSGVLSADLVFNRSFPILPMAPGIEYWNRDPRPIDKDLRRVLVGSTDPRLMIHRWQQVLWNFGVSLPRINYQFLLTSIPGNLRHQDITNHESAESWLQREEQMMRDPTYSTLPREHGVEDPEMVSKFAFGFWLFPLEAIGPYPEPGVPIKQGYRDERNRILDLTKYWPILALMSIPE